MLSLFVRGFCTVGSRKVVDEPASVPLPTLPPSNSSTPPKRPPPPETPPP
ncbi:hypothetical protein OESDEN_19483, partial [Oesophagostomum dentatum]